MATFEAAIPVLMEHEGGVSDIGDGEGGNGVWVDHFLLPHVRSRSTEDDGRGYGTLQ